MGEFMMITRVNESAVPPVIHSFDLKRDYASLAKQVEAAFHIRSTVTGTPPT